MTSGVQHGIRENRIKTVFLIILFPIFLALALFLFFYFGNTSHENRYGEELIRNNETRIENAITNTGNFFSILGPILIIWLLISFIYEKQLIFHFSGAKEITRKEYPELYNIVENLCISRGLKIPKIGLIDEEGMNAFALGRKTSDSWICFTKGLIRNLNPKEIEAVAGHELTHIMNKDTLLMLVMVLYIGAITTIGQILLRSGTRTNDRKSSTFRLPLVGLIFIILGYIFYPLVRLAISRKREYLADAGSVILTQDNQAMISALKKISKRPEVPIKNDQIAAIFIENPLGNLFELFQTHPSIENRIKALEKY